MHENLYIVIQLQLKKDTTDVLQCVIGYATSVYI